MRIICLLFLLCLSFASRGRCQTFSAAACDSSLLTPEEIKKCKDDTIFREDMVARINYIIFLKTELLPKYRAQRKSLVVSDEIRQDLKLLKMIYDSTTSHKARWLSLEMDSNQYYIQPRAYISSLLALETFKFYPDVYAVLLNRIHLSLRPKTPLDQLKQIEKLIDKIYNTLDESTKYTAQKITSQLARDKKTYTKDLMLDLFQGDINGDERMKYNIINFLLWTE